MNKRFLILVLVAITILVATVGCTVTRDPETGNLQIVLTDDDRSNVQTAQDWYTNPDVAATEEPTQEAPAVESQTEDGEEPQAEPTAEITVTEEPVVPDTSTMRSYVIANGEVYDLGANQVRFVPSSGVLDPDPSVDVVLDPFFTAEGVVVEVFNAKILCDDLCEVLVIPEWSFITNNSFEQALLDNGSIKVRVKNTIDTGQWIIFREQ